MSTKKDIKRIVMVLAVMLIWTAWPATENAGNSFPGSIEIVYGAESVTVEVPKFKTAINGVEISNTKAKYPLLVYKGITYFPMTYNFCQELGLATAWDSSKGLYIAVYPNFGDSRNADLGGSHRLGGRYTATVAEYPITVNGASIDNSKEEYPLLTFRSITYFPMTWRFTHDEFGCEMSWDQKEGFGIDYNSHSGITVTEIGAEYAMLQGHRTIYSEELTENGDIQQVHAGEEIIDYKLDYKSNSIVSMGAGDKIMDEAENRKAGELYDGDSSKSGSVSSEDIGSLVESRSGKLIYNGKEIKDISALLIGSQKDDKGEDGVVAGEASDVQGNDLSRYDEEIAAYCHKWTLGDVSVIGISFYYRMSVPPPYTPKEFYVFIEKDGVVTELKEWDTNRSIENVYAVGDGSFYICSDYRSLGGRMTRNQGEILKIGSDMSVENFNDLYPDFGSFRGLGMSEGKLYVLATDFSDHPSMGSDSIGSGSVNLMIDGYFTVDGSGKMTKVHEFIWGDTFMTPGGGLYCILKNGEAQEKAVRCLVPDKVFR